jgi:hypothetical protein
MRLFPQTHEFILNELLNHRNAFYKYLSKNSDIFNNVSYEELLQAFNVFLNNLAEQEEEYDNELNVENSRKIESLIEACKDFIYMTFTTKLTASNFDICALLLIIKKREEDNLTKIEIAEDFINNIVTQLGNPITNEQVLNNPSLIDYLSYDNILDDDFMCDFFLSYNIVAFNDNPITFELLINGKYSYLHLNEFYKSSTYRVLDFNQLPDYMATDELIINDFLTYNPEALTYNDAWRGDREKVILAISNFPKALSYASGELKADRGIVLTAVKANGLALEFAAEPFKSDREIVYSAVANNPSSLKFVSNNILEVVLQALQGN